MISPSPKVEGVSFTNLNAVILQHSPPSYVNPPSPAVMEQTDHFWVEGAIVVTQKVVHSIRNIINSGKLMTTELLLNFWEEVEVKREPNLENRVGLRI